MKKQNITSKRLAVIICLAVLLIAVTATIMLASRQQTKSQASQNSQLQDVTKTTKTNSPTNPTSPTPTTKQPQSSFDKTKYSTTDPASPWIVVNKQHPLNPKNYAPSDLTSVGNGQYMRAEAATALSAMLSAANTAGYTITADSAYRSYDTQVSVYNKEVADYGQTVADSESARPGFSEHQTGWAVDIGSGNCHITDCFGDLPAGKWADANAYKYGFILRYTSADTDVTGYRAEAWHFRYIGTSLAVELHDKGVATLEEYFGISGGSTYAN